MLVAVVDLGCAAVAVERHIRGCACRGCCNKLCIALNNCAMHLAARACKDMLIPTGGRFFCCPAEIGLVAPYLGLETSQRARNGNRAMQQELKSSDGHFANATRVVEAVCNWGCLGVKGVQPH